MMFWAVLGVAVVAVLVFVYFFLAGLAKGTVSSFNRGLWTRVLLALAAVLGVGCALRVADHEGYATAVLMLLAVPAVLAGLICLGMIIAKPRWN